MSTEPVRATQANGECPAPELPPLRSIHTTTFGQILQQRSISLLVSTYQAGKLVVLRPNDDGGVNTHFRNFPKPMGIAAQGDRLAIGTALEVWEYHNLPAVAAQLEPEGKYDACFLPRSAQVTGDIQIHEMAWAAEELWFVNTRFSCLCTRGPNYSFVPRWRPPFVTALAPEDRCHLNGLGLCDGQVRYATALGETDSPDGWRANKQAGGIVMDVQADAVICRGLSMPHSPRRYAGRLWLLESGAGGFGFVDPLSGAYELVATLPGFTRGLDFSGPLAFIGLSQVRESAVFSGLAITERPPEERVCGVWVVDLRTGQTVAYLKFADAVQEIFAVQVLHGHRFPDVLNDDPARLANSFVLPDEALDTVATPFVRRAPVSDPRALKPIPA
jgi:uncharacterized protein (TIGR03032 family)